MVIILVVMAALVAAQAAPAEDPNASARRPSLDFRVFGNMDRPLPGLWELEVPRGRAWRIRIQAQEPAGSGAFVGVEEGQARQLLRLSRKKEGIGYEGQLLEVMESCGIDTIPISEFVPLGDSAVLRFETKPTEIPCPPMDGGGAGRLHLASSRGGAVRLRNLSEISSTTVRDEYSIGGDRSTTVSHELALGGITVEDGAEVKFVQRFKAPLDGSLWFEVEAIVSPEAGVNPPRGFVRPSSLRFVGSLTLKRIE